MTNGVYSKLTGYHNRRSIRLPGYDYSQHGYYFVTICLHDRTQQLFGDIPVGAGSKPAPHLTEHGKIVQYTWNDLPNHIPNIALDEFTIMPNHIHGIIRIIGQHLNRAGLEHRAGLEPAPTTVGLPEIIRQLKTFSAKQINKSRNTAGQPVWQRNYYEHVVRDENSLYFIRKYIRENPLNWNSDNENHINREILEFDMAETLNTK